MEIWARLLRTTALVMLATAALPIAASAQTNENPTITF